MKLGVYKFNPVCLINVNPLALSPQHQGVLFFSMTKFADFIYKLGPTDLQHDHTGPYISLSKMTRQHRPSTPWQATFIFFILLFFFGQATFKMPLLKWLCRPSFHRISTQPQRKVKAKRSWLLEKLQPLTSSLSHNHMVCSKYF